MKKEREGDEEGERNRGKSVGWRDRRRQVRELHHGAD